jgi:serine phosphatase RsbU (regulator of sigma subunit)
LAYESQERTLLQVPIQPELAQAIKRYVADQKKLVESNTLNMFYDDAVEWYLKESTRDNSLMYLASSRRQDNKYRSLWLDSVLLEKVRKRSAKDDISINRIVYSAIAHFLRRKDYF